MARTLHVEPPTGAASIQVLEPAVVERIAAGEVIERPVSVVRELIDNALDAGARDIRIEIRGGGLRSIRVLDDGCGIRADQVEMALRHHATSKIREAEDLLRVGSLGFRGEALPSIAAVSELSILTATEDTLGVRLDLRYGEAADRSYLPRVRGTSVTARNLFGNLPGRLKFIGNARAESTLIKGLVRRYALAHPGVRLHLTLDGHVSLRTSGAGIEQAIGEVFGPALAQAFLPLGPGSERDIAWAGRISANHVTRSTRHHITLLVNDRCVQVPSVLAAFEHAYRPLLPRGRHPIAILSLTVPRSSVDVNVHPSKAQVKLRDESIIAKRLQEAVRESLGHAVHAPPNRSFAIGPTQFELPRLVAEEQQPYLATSRFLRDLHVVGQVHGALILAEGRGGLYLIDQHRAHERAIYELLQQQHAEGRAGQLLLEPLHIEMTARQLARLEHRLPELAALGFVCEWFGGRSFLVRSIPVIPETSDLGGVIEDLLDLAGEETDWQHRLLASVSCRGATKRGRPLTVEQCRELLDLLAGTESPAICPHGSPIILQFDDRFLERQFDW
jgi:DNA mismatch repair protein MutL